MASEDDVFKVPPDLTTDAAATVSVNPCTAFRILKDFEDLKPGEGYTSHQEKIIY